MKWFHWLAVIAALYFVVTGVNEFVPIATPIDSLPDWEAVVAGTGTPNTGGGNYLAGGLDLATAAAIYFFVLHKHFMGM